MAFGLLPVLGGEPLPPGPPGRSSALACSGAALIAVAPFANGRHVEAPNGASRGRGRRRRAARSAAMGFGTSRWGAGAEVSLVEGSSVELAAALLAALWLVAVIGFAASLSPVRARPRQLALPGCDARALRRSPSRADAGRLERARAPGRLPARRRVRVPARRRVAGDRGCRVRAGGRGRAGAGRARDPRRARAVPVRDLDAGEHARVGCAARAGAAPSEARLDRSAAGSALRGARAVLGRRLGALRLGAPSLRRRADGGRRARRRARRRPAGAARAGRADRGLPHRAGGARERAPPRGRAPRRTSRSRSAADAASSR